MREQYLLVLETLVKTYRANEQYIAARDAAQRLAQTDPFYEEAHYQLIQLYHLLGRPQEAHAQFQRYQTIWRDELALEPSPRMIALGHQIEIHTSTAISEAENDVLSLLKKAMQVLSRHPNAAWQAEDHADTEALCQQIFDHTRRMGQSLKAQHAHAEAQTYFALALEALSRLPDSRERQQHELVIRCELDDLYDWNANIKLQGSNLLQAAQVAAQLGDLSTQAEVLARHAWTQMRHGQYETAINTVQRVLDICAMMGDSRREAHPYRLLAIAITRVSQRRGCCAKGACVMPE